MGEDRYFKPAASIPMSINTGHWHVSFNHDEDNRVCQSELVCQSCNQRDPAHHNAAALITKRGVRLVLRGGCVQKRGKKCGILKNKVGEVISEPLASVPSTLGETEVSRLGGNTQATGSWTQETPASVQA